MFSSGADVNLNAVYRSTSAGTTKFVIGETYRQAGTNAVFKFVEIGTATPTIVQGVILAQNGGVARSWDGSLASGTIGSAFAGVAQNDTAIIPADIGSGVTVCVWAQIAGLNVSNVAVFQPVKAAALVSSEVGLGLTRTFQPVANSNGLAAVIDVTDSATSISALISDKSADVHAVNPAKILATFDGATAAAADFQSLEVGDAITAHGVATGGASTIDTIYKDTQGVVRGLVYSVTAGDYVNTVNHAAIVNGGTSFGNASSICTPGNVTLNGMY